MRWRTAFALLAVACLASACATAFEDSAKEDRIASWSSVTVGVRDLDAALELWIDSFGFEVAELKRGSDSELAHLWSLEPGDIAKEDANRFRIDWNLRF